MGREKIVVNRVVAGVVCAIEFPSEILATTLCSEAVSEGLIRVAHGAKPLVRVSVQPEGGLDELKSLRTALKQLSVLDPNIRVIEQENGELAMFAAGIIFLQFRSSGSFFSLCNIFFGRSIFLNSILTT